MLNHITIMGRPTRDPELKTTSSGISAEFVCRYFSKGRMAVVSGRLQTRNWTDKDGNKRKAVEIVAENVYFGESKRNDSEPSAPAAPSDFAPIEGDDESLPF